jgi:hypothetical protein
MQKIMTGCWAQPPESFARFVSSGITVFINPDLGNPPRFTQIQVFQKVKAAGGVYICKPDSPETLEYAVADPACIAIATFKDEPDLYLPAPNVDKPGYDKYIAQQIALDGWIAKQVAGRKPIFVNFAGSKVTAGTSEPVRPYSGAMQKPWVDYIESVSHCKVGKNIICQDWHPSNQNRVRYPDSFCGLATKFLKLWFGETNFDHWGFVESSDEMLDKSPEEKPGRAPTASELEAQVKSLLDEGAKGIVFFSHTFMGLPWDANLEVNAWDGSSPELRAKRKEIALRLNPIVIPPQTNPLEGRVSALEAALNDLKSRLDKVEFYQSENSKGLEDLKSKAIISLEVRRGV